VTTTTRLTIGRAISSNDTLADAHSHLCNALVVAGENYPGQGDYAAAAPEERRAAYPTSAEAHNNLCNALVDGSRSRGVYGDFDAPSRNAAGVEAAPVYPAFNNLCNAVGTVEQPITERVDRNQAIAACKSAIGLKPTYPERIKSGRSTVMPASDALDHSTDRRGEVLQMSTAEYRTAITQNRASAARRVLGAVLWNSSPDALRS
jgi:hypothetical protein